MVFGRWGYFAGGLRGAFFRALSGAGSLRTFWQITADGVGFEIVSCEGVGSCPAASAQGEVIADAAFAAETLGVSHLLKEFGFGPQFFEFEFIVDEISGRNLQESTNLNIAGMAYKTEPFAAHTA